MIPMNKPLAPLPLRQANVKRWLDARTSRTKVELNAADMVVFRRMICEQKLPTEVQFYQDDQSELRVQFDSKDKHFGFYVLEIGSYSKCKAQQLFFL